jgi:HSP20 family protein
MYNVKFKNQALVPGFFQAMDKFLQDDFQTQWKTVQPAVNIVEHEKSYEIQLLAPGLSKADFKVSVEKNLLTISYQKTETESETKPKYVRKEYHFNSFSRTFTLNETLDADQIDATYENGILHVSIPRTEVKEVEVKSFTVK